MANRYGRRQRRRHREQIAELERAAEEQRTIIARQHSAIWHAERRAEEAANSLTNQLRDDAIDYLKASTRDAAEDIRHRHTREVMKAIQKAGIDKLTVSATPCYDDTVHVFQLHIGPVDMNYVADLKALSTGPPARRKMEKTE